MFFKYWLLGLFLTLSLIISDSIQEESPSANVTESPNSLLSSNVDEASGSGTNEKRWVTLTNDDRGSDGDIKAKTAKQRRRLHKKLLLKKQLEESQQSQTESENNNNNNNYDHQNEFDSNNSNNNPSSHESSTNKEHDESSQELSSSQPPLPRQEYAKGTLQQENIPILNSDEAKHVPSFVFSGPERKLVQLFPSENDDHEHEHEDELSSPAEKVLLETLTSSSSSGDSHMMTNSDFKFSHSNEHTGDSSAESNHDNHEEVSKEHDLDYEKDHHESDHEESHEKDYHSREFSRSEQFHNSNEYRDHEVLPPIEIVVNDGKRKGGYKTIPADESIMRLVTHRPSYHDNAPHGYSDSETERGHNHKQTKVGGKKEEKSVKNKQTQTKEKKEDSCPRPSQVWNGTKNTWNEFRNAKSWNQSFSALGKSASNVFHSVISCTKSLWQGFTSLLGFGENKKRSIPKEEISGVAAPEAANVKSRKRRGFEDYWTRFTANFKSKPEASEEENDKSIETENDDEEPSEFGRRLSIIQVTVNEKVTDPAKHALGEVGQGLKNFFSKSYSAISNVGAKLFDSSDADEETTPKNEVAEVEPEEQYHADNDKDDKDDEDLPDPSEFEESLGKALELDGKKRPGEEKEAPPKGFFAQRMEVPKKYFENLGRSVYNFFGKRR